MKSTPCEEDVVLVVIIQQVFVKPLHLLLHEGEINISTPSLEILAVEVHYKVSDYRSVVLDSMVLGCLGASIPKCRVIRITGAILPTPILLQRFPIPDDITSSMLAARTYFEDFSWEVAYH